MSLTSVFLKLYMLFFFIVVRMLSHVWLLSTLWAADTRLSVLNYLPKFAKTHVHWVSETIQPSHSLFSPSPPILNLSYCKGLFQWVGSSHQVAKILELHLQHQSFQWIVRIPTSHYILFMCACTIITFLWRSRRMCEGLFTLRWGNCKSLLYGLYLEERECWLTNWWNVRWTIILLLRTTEFLYIWEGNFPFCILLTSLGEKSSSPPGYSLYYLQFTVSYYML